MGKELELYKAFIDGLVEQKDSVTAKWVLEGVFPHTEDNQAKNKFLSSLTLEQKKYVGRDASGRTYCWNP